MGVRYLRRPPRPPARRQAAGGSRHRSAVQGSVRTPATLMKVEGVVAVAQANDGGGLGPCERSDEGGGDGAAEDANERVIHALRGAP